MWSAWSAEASRDCCHRRGGVAQLAGSRCRLAAAESELARLNEPAPDRAPIRAPIERLIPPHRRALPCDGARTEQDSRARSREGAPGFIEALEEPITLYPENGVLVAEISYRAPLPLVRNVSENMVAGARNRIRSH